MPRPFAGLQRVMRVVSRPHREADDEIVFHIEMRTEELMASGMQRDDARRHALRHFGDVDAVRKQLHSIDQWENRCVNIREWLAGARDDLRYAARSLRREPALALGVVITLTLAIGANAAMFGVVRQLMLAPPSGIGDASRVARVHLVHSRNDGEQYRATTTSYPAFLALHTLSGVFAGSAAERTADVVVGTAADAIKLTALAVTGDYFSVLKSPVPRGRSIGPGDDTPPDGRPVVVLSHAYWQRRFGGEPEILGHELVLDDRTFTIVGVAAPGFNGDGTASVDLFIPLNAAMQGSGETWRTSEGMNVVSIVARLHPGVSGPMAAKAASATIHHALRQLSDERPLGVELESVVPGKSARQTTQARFALGLSAVSAIVLLIAAANVATLLLLRAVKRRREIAVRVALGVGRARLARQLILESLLLATCGAAFGLLLSRWLAAILRATLLTALAPSEQFIDSHVLIAAIGTAVMVGVAAGLVPFLQIGHPRITAELHAGGSSGAARHSVVQRTLIGVQVALSVVLIVAAGLFVQSLNRIASQNLGFSTAKLLYVELDFRRHLNGTDRDLEYARLARALNGLGGVSRATIVQAMPFGAHHIPPIGVPGRTAPPSVAGQLPMMYAATPAYLELMDVRVIDGRLITDHDVHGTPMIVLVNETMAREVWPGERAVGKCIRIGYDGSSQPSPLASPSLPCREVVGVVADSRARSLVPQGHEATLMQFYVPFAQLPLTMMPDASTINGLLVGVTSEIGRMAPAVQQFLQGASSTPVVASVRPYHDLLEPQLRPWRLGATVFSTFGLLALGIAGVGLFGVISYVAAQRTREIGLRLALGSPRSAVGRLVVADALATVSWGAGVGVVAAVAVGPLVKSLLFETSARDVRILIGAAVVHIGVALLAAAVPAWRATRTDPLGALRGE